MTSGGHRKRPSPIWNDWFEYGWRKWYHWKPGQGKSIKRAAIKAERREGKRECNDH